MGQFRGSEKEERPRVWGRERSLALKTQRQGKEEGRRAAAGLCVGGAHAIRKAARSLLYLQ